MSNWKKPLVVMAMLVTAFGMGFGTDAAMLLPTKVGLASYYSANFHGKCCTASGERVNVYDYTAAHRTLPFGSRVRVTNLNNRRSVIVRINDRGPYQGSRIIDLSKAAFNHISLNNVGVIRVRLDLVYTPGKPTVSMLPTMASPRIRP